MTLMLALLTVAAAALLAFANGANDVSKGVATLAGSGRASYAAAIRWGTLWTFAGALASFVIAAGLVRAFTSALVAPDVLGLATFPLAVAAGAVAWVLFASATGLPVSTTHALTGAILGVALMAEGAGAVRWWMLLSAIAAPLALSPLVSAAIGYAVHGFAARTPTCICVEDGLSPVSVSADGTLAGTRVPRLVTCQASVHNPRPEGFFPAGTLHWIAAAALSFARGVNDNAKIAAIAAPGLTAVNTDLWVAFGVAAIAMTTGSYAAGMRVTRTLGERVVRMEPETGLAASLVSAGLVLSASFYALPVSTTHVATGAIVGAAVRQDPAAVRWRRVGGFVAAWIVTLPVAGLLAAAAVWLLGEPR